MSIFTDELNELSGHHHPIRIAESEVTCLSRQTVSHHAKMAQEDERVLEAGGHHHHHVRRMHSPHMYY